MENQREDRPTVGEWLTGDRLVSGLKAVGAICGVRPTVSAAEELRPPRSVRGDTVPKLKIEGKGSVEVAAKTRLVKAIMQQGVDILHRCGGNARCTTCRVEFVAGEPDQMTKAERDKLIERELLGKARLSCQILCSHDMEVRPLMRLADNPSMTDAGPDPEVQITPEPVWVTK